MRHQGRVTPVLFVVVLVCLLALAGCRGREASPPPPVPQPPPTAPPAAAPPTAESSTPSAPAPAVVSPTPPTPAAKAAAPREATRAGEAFRWTGKPRLAGIPEGSWTYFVHSYYVEPTDESLTATTTDYGYEFVSAVQRGNLFASQWHPEKSASVGLKVFENFRAFVDSRS